jgi:hypothetical protein
MSTATVSNTVTALGKTFTSGRTTTADGGVIKDPTLAAAKTGGLTTRTDANTGTLTMTAGHGITTGQRLDVYWDGGARYGMTVGTVSTNSVPIDGGGGDDLPAAATAITAMVPQLETFSAETAALRGLFVGAPVPAYVVILDAADAVLKAVYVDGAADAYQWDVGSDAANPLSDDAATAYFSHGSSTASRQVTAVALVN